MFGEAHPNFVKRSALLTATSYLAFAATTDHTGVSHAGHDVNFVREHAVLNLRLILGNG